MAGKYDVGDRVVMVSDVPPVPRGTKGTVVELLTFPFDIKVRFDEGFDTKGLEDKVTKDWFATWDRTATLFDDEVEWLDEDKVGTEAPNAALPRLTALLNTPTVFEDTSDDHGVSSLPVGESVEDLLALAAKEDDELDYLRHFLAVMTQDFHEGAVMAEQTEQPYLAMAFAQAADAFHTAFHMLDDYISEHSNTEEAAV